MKNTPTVSSLSELLSGISRMAFAGNIKVQDIENQLRFSLIQAAQEVFPHKNISELRELTGIPRAKIKEYLEGEVPKFKQDKLATLLNELANLMNHDNLLPRRGEKSFTSAAYDIINSSFSPDIALNSLIKLGAIELAGDNIRVLTTNLTVSNDLLLSFKEISKTTLFLIESGLHNVSEKTPDARLFQRTIASTQIPRSSLKELHKEIMSVLKAMKTELKTIIDSYEAEVEPDTYGVYGVSLFEFSDSLNNIK